MTGYKSGSLIWGQEPPVATNTVAVANVMTYPNPAMSATGATLQYTVNQLTTGLTAAAMDPIYVPDPSTKVYLKIFSAAGRLIWEKTVDGVYYVSTGVHSVAWDGRAAGGHELSPGTYTLKVVLTEPNGSSAGFSRIIMLK
jgi:flagellar hook assembly protein FlgD